MNEWGFAGEISKWWEAAARGTVDSCISDVRIEQATEGDRRRADLTGVDAHNRAVLVVELRLPDHQHSSPFDVQNLRDAVAKAQRVGARWAATSDGAQLVLIDTLADGSLLTQLKRPILLAVPATREGLDVPAKHSQIKASWVELFDQLDPIVGGRADAVTPAPDEMFVEALRTLLATPVAAIRDAVSNRKERDTHFRESLIEWMVDQQGWSHTADEFEDEIQRVADVSAYVFTTRLLFYEALRRAQAQVQLNPLTIQGSSLVAHAAVTAIFAEARRVSGDYETVFAVDEICEYALVSDGAVAGWTRVVEHLEQFDIQAVSYDVLGRLFERLIDPQERYKWGQHYTHPDVVDLMLSLSLPDGSGTVMDPASGGGTFLVRAYVRKKSLNPELSHSERLAEIAGGDISAFAASISTVSLASRDLSFADNYPQIRARSFFKQRARHPWVELPGASDLGGTGTPVPHPVTLPLLDAVVCNPPYIGFSQIGAVRKREADHALRQSAATPNTLQHRYNYHLYFWFHAVPFLKDDGRLVFITSGEWLDSDYGAQLQEWLLRHAHVEMVVESLAETWFTDARVGTVVLAARRRRQDVPIEEFTEPTRFITLRKSLTQLYGCVTGEDDHSHISHVDAFRERLFSLTGTGESEEYDWSVVPQCELFELGGR